MQNNLDKKIQHYLYYNYVPQKKNLSWLEDPLRSNTERFENTPEGAAAALDKAIDVLFSGIGTDGYVVVPISGGWDSRILLGAAIERFDRCKIKCVSYGTPGQLDFNIGRQVAKTFSLEHHAVDLSQIELTWEALLASVQESPWTCVPDGYFNFLSVSHVARSDKDIVLSGFVGDALTGGHLSRATTKKEAIDEFVTEQRREKSIRLYSPDYDPRSALPDLPEESPISSSELLDFGVRQASCIAPIVTPQKQWREWGGNMGRMPNTGARVLAPFAHPRWAGYWLGVPKELKRGQKLYLEMMRYKFPESAGLPSKYSLGTRSNLGYFSTRFRSKVQSLLHVLRPQICSRYRGGLNYLDFAQAFRKREDYQQVLNKTFDVLQEFDVVPWLDLGELKREHMAYQSNHENAFLILIGLAANLYNEEMKSNAK